MNVFGRNKHIMVENIVYTNIYIYIYLINHTAWRYMGY